MGQMFRTGARSAVLAALDLAAASLAVASLAVASLASSLAVSPASANDIWCLRDFNASRGACAFPSGGDCFRAAAIMGGVCERQSAVDGRSRKGNRERQSQRSRSPSWTW
jgi:hypothetical protein